MLFFPLWALCLCERIFFNPVDPVYPVRKQFSQPQKDREKEKATRGEPRSLRG